MTAESNIRGKTVFVTGGTGFVGSHLVERLLRDGCTVRCLVRKDACWLSGLPVERVMGSLHDTSAIRDGLRGVHYVIHAAARTRGLSAEEFERDNVTGSVNLLKLAAEEDSLERVLVMSSLAAIGESTSAMVDESAPLNPVSQYGKSKARMERAIDLFNESLAMTIVRPPAVYGPREADIFTFFKTLSKGLCPIVGSASKAALSLVHVDDLVEGMIKTIESDLAIGKTYFLGSERPYSWGEIRDAATMALNRRVLTITIPEIMLPALGAVTEWVGRSSGTYPPLNREKAREIVHATLMCDSSLAKKEVGYRPKTGLVEGVSGTIAWYKDQNWL